MSGNKTFTIIKPDAFEAAYSGPIIEKIESAGFKILNMRLERLDNTRAGKFYAVHKDKPFFERLCSYMCSGPIIVIELEKENAVEDFRKLIGATNPEDAEEGTIRKLYAKSIEANAVHGSDSDENAQIEINFFFS
ncbi:MAG: nucleoside-diphosphate kinase [Bacteroidota bacterium]|nr:nucleoside-diphosphate kinase [Bacteroidota bacterium]